MIASLNRIGLFMLCALAVTVSNPCITAGEPSITPIQPVESRLGEREVQVNKDASAQYPEDTGILLQLDECIEIAIQNNLNLQISRLNDRGSDYNIRIAWAEFFPTFNTGINHSNSRGSNGRGPDGHGTTTVTGGVSQRTPWGTRLDFALDETRRDLNESGRTASGRVTQALWKGAGTDANLVQVRTARINRLINRANLDLDTQRLIFQVQSNYTNIVRLIQEREVARQSVRSALLFLNLTKAREQAGKETRLDVYQADVQLRTRELSLITNERQLESAYDTLKQVMDIDLEERIRVFAEPIRFGDKPEKGTVEVLETDDVKGIVYLVKRNAENNSVIGERTIMFQAQHFNEPQVLADALANRIELLNGRRVLAVQHLQTMLAKNGLGYQVDLVGSYNRNFTNSALNGGAGNQNTDNWSVGVNASIPWGKIADKANYELALLDLQRTEIELKRVRTTVHGDVRSITRTLREAERALIIEALRVEQAKRTVEATRISFERGLKDSFQVVRVEDDLLAAKNQFIGRRLEYVVNLANIDLVVGKATGRVDLEAQTLGGTVDSHLPASLGSKIQPRRAPEADPSCEDSPLNKSRAYRCDPLPEPGTRLILTPERKPPCNCELLDDRTFPVGNR